jgi:hypothetical protein
VGEPDPVEVLQAVEIERRHRHDEADDQRYRGEEDEADEPGGNEAAESDDLPAPTVAGAEHH